MCNNNSIKKYGTQPIDMQWSVIRGDTSSLKIEFFNNDENTYWDTTGWTYISTSYDPQSDILDLITVTGYPGYAILTASEELTSYWGTKYGSVVAELPFDLQVVIPTDGTPITWTPILGTIRVLGDVSPGSIL